MTNRSDATPITVETALGTLRGQWLGGIARFGGIPYGEAPVGELRFRPPVPKAPWSGELDATEFGPIARQNPSFMDVMFGLEPEPQSEDCLRLNVFTPDPALSGADAAPVMVWIHGGAFEMGSGSTSIYDGATFARAGVVFVSINYRLGPFGFCELSGLDSNFASSGNAGLLDQVEALRWVQANIASFGGDPQRVTVFGESAGAMSTSLLMSSPLTDGLMHQAICQSGALNAARDLDFARSEGADVMQRGGWTSIEAAQHAPVEELLAIHAALMGERWGDPVATLRASGSPLTALAFRPVADGIAVPVDPRSAIANGAARGINLIAGHNMEEWRLFSLLMPGAANEEALIERVGLVHEDPTKLIATYRASRPDDTPAQLESAVLTDLLFRAPIAELVDAQAGHGAVFQYQFDWQSPMLGAGHAVELPFVFEQLHDQRLAPFFGAEPPQSVATAMSSAWASFAHGGTPSIDGSTPWQPIGDNERPVLRFNTELSIEFDPAAEELNAWR